MEKINGLSAFEGTCNLLKFKDVEWERIGTLYTELISKQYKKIKYAHDLESKTVI